MCAFLRRNPLYMSIMFYLTFGLMMLLSYGQWKKLKSVKKTQLNQRRKHQLVTLAFGMSYLARAAFNTISSIVGYDKMTNFKEYGGDYNYGW